jgi:DNA polymerase-3 subunit alpha/error-prone DNA polymerase
LIDAEGEFFDTAHFSDSLQKYPFKVEVVICYWHGRSGLPLPTITISKMAKMPFIPDPRYSNSTDRQYKAHQQIKEDVSMTHRALTPQEVNLPRYKMS